MSPSGRQHYGKPVAVSPSRTEYRTARWIAQFEAGKVAAVKQYDKGRSADVAQRRQEREDLIAAMTEIKAGEGAWPTDPFNHGRKIAVSELLEMHML